MHSSLLANAISTGESSGVAGVSNETNLNAMKNISNPPRSKTKGRKKEKRQKREGD